MIKEINQQDYEGFLSSEQNSSFLQSWQWGDFQALSGKKPFRYGYFRDSKLTAVVQLLEIRTPGFKGSYFYAPYGPIGQDLKLFIEELAIFVRENCPSIKFIRFEPIAETGFSGGVKCTRIQPKETFISDLGLTEPELLARMHHKTRYNIKVAEKHGVEVKIIQSANLTDTEKEAVADMFCQTAVKQDYLGYDKDYYLKLLNFGFGPASPLQLSVARAFVKEELASTAILLDFKNTRTYLFGGSNYELRKFMAPYAMHWQAILQAKHNSLEFYDWWGLRTSSGGHAGFADFKLRWGGSEKNYPEAFDLVLGKNWYFIYKNLRWLNRKLQQLIKRA